MLMFHCFILHKLPNYSWLRLRFSPTFIS